MDYRVSSSFKHCYRCQPVSAIEKPHLEVGDKIIMPVSALDHLASLLIEYPMLFKLSNPATERVSHCGVLEFTADEGMIYMSDWMMENMMLKEGDIVDVRSATLCKATYVKLQPHSKDFLDITNPKAILETALRSFTCLTTGDTIMVPYNNNKFYIDILETQPTSAVSIVETDCEVDFAQPLDYKEPEKPEPSNSMGKKEAEVHEFSKEAPKFIPFTGVARRLDGKHSTESAQPVPSPILKAQKSEGTNGSISSTNSSRKHSGKLVFGSKANKALKEAPKVSSKKTMPEPQKIEQKFQPFSGKSYSLGR
ncbi:Ubiquitin fusion degradation protein UFD1 [Macleaya cordata]|uniref:Ubiquitin fusion degradation protein UFD1 n=1 Tax=Macleaya cordata TaxID=56857 RepID=A0A200R570_MACCD|nr:Ubiquitin fusion degradation protein UFD1 [Macleaya cordata]